jgi:hypothetical protein
MTQDESAKRGYEADVSDDEDFLPLTKKAKRDCDCISANPGFGSEYHFSECGVSTPDNMSTASGTRRAETDTEVESACSEIEPESTDESESLGSHDTGEYESECLSETLGSSDTRSSDSPEGSGSDDFDHDVHEHSDDSGSDGFDVNGNEIDWYDSLSTASTV